MMAMAPRALIQELTGARLHLQHGPIDIVLKAWGAPAAVRAAYEAAARRFPQMLPELAGELAALRRPIADAPAVTGAVALRMVGACRNFTDRFITPMAAVAGSVADEILAAMCGAAPLEKAYVNDGGDIAVHLAPGASLDIGIASDFAAGPVPGVCGTVALRGGDGVGGIATSGWRGRSFSLGIADSVTVLAASAAGADAAATLVANAVDIEAPCIERRPASSLDPDSDLGERLVTVGVGPLADGERWQALRRGLDCADAFRRRGLILDAALTCGTITTTLADLFGHPLERHS